MLECPHLDSIFEMLKWIPIATNGYTMPDNKNPFSAKSYFMSIQMYKVTIETFATPVHVSNAKVSAS